MVRTEERLRVDTERHETGRVRLRKYVDVEQVTGTVPVSHEQVRVERHPVSVSDIDPLTAAKAFTEEEHEISLTAERPVVAKEAVPVERVRVATQQVAEQVTVEEQVRKERIEVDADPDARMHVPDRRA